MMSTPTPAKVLTGTAVSELLIETGTMKLLQEWLANFFDGNPHDVGANLAVPFTNPTLYFQQSAIVQPTDTPGGAATDTLAITTVWCDPTKKWKSFEVVDGERQEVVYLKANFNFWIRATGTNAKAQAKTTADLLHALLGNSAAAKPLAQKGVKRLCPQAPRAVQDTDYVLRLVTCGATLRYPILSQISQVI